MPLSKKNRYVACLDCGCRLEMNGICKICGHRDEPLLPGMVPDVVGLTLPAAALKFADPECQLSMGTATEENDETVPIGAVVASVPEAGTQLSIGDPVDIFISLGPAA